MVPPTRIVEPAVWVSLATPRLAPLSTLIAPEFVTDSRSSDPCWTATEPLLRNGTPIAVSPMLSSGWISDPSLSKKVPEPSPVISAVVS